MEIIKYNFSYQKRLLDFIKIVFDENDIVLDLNNKHSDILNPLSVYFAFFIVVDNNKVVGCVGVKSLNSEKTIAELKRLYLLKSYHRCGIGGQLVKLVLKEAISRNYMYIRLSTKKLFSNAVALVEKYGFYKIERYNDSSADLFYEKLL